MPDFVASALSLLVGAEYNSSSAFWHIDCGQAYNQTTLHFTLSWPVVNVTIAELVIPASDDLNADPVCHFGITSNSDGYYYLGDLILRNAYIVYNLGNNELSIAQTKVNVTTSNIQEITNGVDGVPGAVRAPTTTATPSQSGLSMGASAGIGVGASLGAMLAISLVGFFFLGRRRQMRKIKTSTDDGPVFEKPELPSDMMMRPTELGSSEVGELPPDESSQSV